MVNFNLEILFESNIIRTYEAKHETFANPFEKGKIVFVTAFMISNHADLMEGRVILIKKNT